MKARAVEAANQLANVPPVPTAIVPSVAPAPNASKPPASSPSATPSKPPVPSSAEKSAEPSSAKPIKHRHSSLIAGLTSFTVHLILLLVLAIWTIASIGGGGGNSDISAVGGDSGDNGESLETFEIEGPSGGGSDQAEEIATPSPLVLSPSPLNATLDTEGAGQTETSPSSRPFSDTVTVPGGKGLGPFFTESGVEQRGKGKRGAAGERNGATPASEAAVDAALSYIASHQRNNGSWSTRLDDAPCRGECSHGSFDKDPHEIAATGLALLCFLGRGNTMHEGEYSDNVSRGVYFLIQNLKMHDGRGSWLTTVAASEMYEHGIATLALCEALQMTDDEGLKEPCQAAINYIIYAQHTDGGWDYHPKSPGDLSIVGWQAMALKSAVSAKLIVPPETIQGIDRFLKRSQVGEFMYRYRPNQKPTPSITAIGTLMRIFRGAVRSEPSIIRAVEYLAKEGPDENDVYYNYYATQVLFHYGGKLFEHWNYEMREYLINTQVSSGHMAGSWWFPADFSNEIGGRLYVTAMACLTLEVYYRYMPVYENKHNEFQL